MAWLIFLLALAASLAALLIAPRLLAPRRASGAKEVRFEAGNPPYGKARRRMAMQYIVYVYLAVAVESVVGMSIAFYLMDPGSLPEILAAVAAATAVAYLTARGHGD
ncbi:MAG: NADH-quinone oxidoreductase subunit A [Thermoproteus sp.]